MTALTLATLDALRRGDLDGARTLRLPGLLKEFPREILGLADTLELLDLSDGTLSELPPDIGRLRHLKVLFCSNNRFSRLPPSLGDCASLTQVGFRGAGLGEVPAESLPPNLRWLTLTDNRIETLPAALGERPLLQKLMLAGNRLRTLPESLAGAPRLELLRLAANRFETLPPWLADLPRLAWMAWAGNPAERASPPPAVPPVPWLDLAPGAVIGEGASGRVHGGSWETRPVALKLFKGAMTSDGLPDHEMAACLAAGEHPNLTAALGRIVGHPEGTQGLVMPLLPPHWRVLAGPPSLESCSRDVYDPALRLPPAAALRIARGIAPALAHLHARGLMHGDLYAHNILWDGTAGDAVLGDFGAASALPDGADGLAWRRVEVRAFGLLVGELLDRCDGKPAAALPAVAAACLRDRRDERPLMAEVEAALAAA